MKSTNLIFLTVYSLSLFFVTNVNAKTMLSANTDIVKVNNELLLIGSSKESLADACSYIKNYSLFMSQRNLYTVPLLDCSETFELNYNDPKYKEIEHISYKSRAAYYRYDFTDSLENNSTLLYALNITDSFPESIWKRGVEYYAYDSICYNTALVASGILSFYDYGRSLDNIQYFLEKSSFNIEYNEKSKEVVGKVISMPQRKFNLVKSRRSWVMTASNKDETLDNIKLHISENFTPGSIICTPNQEIIDESWINRALNEYLRPMAPDNFNVYIDNHNINKKKVLEGNNNVGGHCFTLLTPEISVESNTNTSHNIVWTSKILNRLAIENTSEVNEAYRFVIHYYQTSQDNILSFSRSTNLFKEGSNHFKMIKIFREIRAQYEGIGKIDSWDGGYTTFSFHEGKKQSFIHYLSTQEKLLKQDPSFYKYFQLIEEYSMAEQKMKSIGDNTTFNSVQLKYWALLSKDPTFRLVDAFRSIITKPWYIYAKSLMN